MRRATTCFAAVFAALISTTAVVDAAPIEYSFFGTGDWTLDGVESNGDFVVNLIGDTSDIQFQPDQNLVLVSGTFSSGGKTFDFTEGGPVDFNEVIDGPVSGGTMIFAQVPAIGSPAAFGLTNSVFESYDLSHALPLTSGTPVFVDTSFLTSGGSLEFISISAISFQATLVPEPSIWAMMALGFAALGFAGYRRARKDQISALA